LREGYPLVMGNRFRGGIRKGAMPLLHRYLGNPVLSFVGRLLFHARVGDFHCGLRGFDREAIGSLKLRTTGMEFASELIVKASLAGWRIAEVPRQHRLDIPANRPESADLGCTLHHSQLLLRQPEFESFPLGHRVSPLFTAPGI
jgi:hypothetical protein